MRNPSIVRANLLRRWIAVFSVPVVVVASVAAGLLHHCWTGERAMREMFEGPAEAVAPDPVSYYPQVVYDLETYNAAEDLDYEEPKSPIPGLAQRTNEPMHKWADGAGKDELEEKIRARAAVDGITAVTRLVRLRTPSVYRARRPSRKLSIAYPPDGALFPPNLCPPCVEWDDRPNNVWQVIVHIEGTGKRWTAITEDRHWWFPDAVWQEVRSDGVEREVSIQIKGARCKGDGLSEGPIQASQPVRFRISRDPADRFIVYRLVAPPFSTLKTPDTFVRDITTFETRLFLSARRSYCFNCHTFSSTSGSCGKLSIQARYMAPGPETQRAYFGIYDMATRQGRKIALPFQIQMTTFMAWSPDETKLALSANQQVAAFPPIVFETQSAGEPTSDLAVYDLQSDTVGLLPGASDPDYLELFPRWTPDGKSIVFCRAASGFHPELVQYDLYVVPFNDGKGGDAAPIPAASNNSRSNYYPRFSPDGKWFSFCQSDGGDLIKSSSDICVMNAGLEGPAHRLECNAEFAADSWHSWSSNGGWIVFTSKRDGVFARLYLAHIGEDGHASPAVRLPLKNVPMQSFNIPEFLERDPPIAEEELYNVIRVETQPCEIAERILDE